MSYHDNEVEGQKTVVGFVVGLLIGGLLVWAFSGPPVEVNHESPALDGPTRAEDACIEQGGIPIYAGMSNNLSDCKKL